MQHSRPSTPNGKPLAKKSKTLHDSTSVSDSFHHGLLRPESAAKLHEAYTKSKPFKYVVVNKLFQDDLLVKAKDECINELSFTEKETDIYKVQQTGDLASLSYLGAEQLALLPSLLRLRDCLYSPEFRDFVRTVTGCGPISGSKQDMSVNTYKQGCHLLNHDDVIGTRRVSYILYMPLPYGTAWKPEWGGALEMYDTAPGAGGVPEPTVAPVASVPPSWNQFIFFEVQPGRSFHSVEEVVIDSTDGRQRLSISGWFHAAQEGEDGYDPNPAAELQSSLQQLTSTATPLEPYAVDGDDVFVPAPKLSKAEISALSEFVNPVYLQARTIKALAARFVEESSLELHDFLAAPLATRLEAGLREQDTVDGLGPDRAVPMPPHTAGSNSDWEVAGPPHKRRHCILASSSSGPAPPSTPVAADVDLASQVRSVQDELLASPSFRAWLSIITSLVPTRRAVQARRFRPGLDYTLATSEQNETRLDVVLGLTPGIAPALSGPSPDDDEADDEVLKNAWASGKWGGWECYMAPHEDEDDPAVYRGSSSKKVAAKSADGAKPEGEESETNGASHTSGNGDLDEDEQNGAASDEEDDDANGTLLTVQPGFNRLLVVLRDEGVMHFVKYVSAAATGSRWDVCGEFEVGMVASDDDDDDDD